MAIGVCLVLRLHDLFPHRIPTYHAPFLLRYQRHKKGRRLDERFVSRTFWCAAALDAIDPVYHVVGLAACFTSFVAFGQIGSPVVARRLDFKTGDVVRNGVEP